MGHIERRAQIYAALYWERVVSPQVRAQMMCAAGKALCDASQLALPTSDGLARQGGDSDRTRAAPHRPPLGKTCRRKALRNSSRGRSAFWVLQRSARASSHDTLGLSGELEREHTQHTAPSSCSRARASRLLFSPRDGLCSITFNKPTRPSNEPHAPHKVRTRTSIVSA